MYKKDLENLLDNHTPYIEVTECGLCGQHESSSCSCGWYDKYGGVDAWITHLVDQVED